MQMFPECFPIIKTTGCEKKQENMIHNQGRGKSIKTNWEMTEVLQLAKTLKLLL